MMMTAIQNDLVTLWSRRLRADRSLLIMCSG